MILLLDGYKMAKFPQDFTEKSTLNTDDILFLADSEDLFEWIPKADKKFTLTSLINFLKGKLSTTDVTEWTNLYYTDGRVSSSSLATATSTALWLRELLSNKKTNFSTIDNTGYATTQAIVNYIAALGTDITGLTEEMELDDDDELIFYDTSAGSNKKLPWYNINLTIDAGTTYLVWEANTPRANATWDWVKQKEIECRVWWTFRVSFAMESSITWGTVSTRSWEAQIYKNWVAFWTLRTNSTEYGDPVTHTEDLTFSAWDLIQLYNRKTGTIWSGPTRVKDFSVKYDLVSFNRYNWTVNLD